MYCEIEYIKYDVINLIKNTHIIILLLAFIIAIELIILINYIFNDIGLLFFMIISWLLYLIPIYKKAKKYCNK